ncbi:CyP450 monooxygenase [Cubamyces sp. BRFM 1775]|nr:CyP450 monooxygenase [Cubamyces sp. BRFM 1775]
MVLDGTARSALAAVAIVLALLILLVFWRYSRRELPPGPPGLPLIGNFYEIPGPHADGHITYADLATKYGDVVTLRAFDQTLIILGSATAAIDLLEKRSIYADRPASPLVEMTGWIWALVFKRYGAEWRDTRRVFWQHFHPKVVGTFRPVQLREAQELLRRLLRVPNDLEGEIKMSMIATTLTVAQGLPEGDITHRWVDAMMDTVMGFTEASRPFGYLVEVFPWLRYVPAWVPGMDWKRNVLEWREPTEVIRDKPFKLAQAAMDREEAMPSMLSQLLEDLAYLSGPDAEREEAAIKDATSSVVVAGVDTTSATLIGFFCAMLMNPKVQKRAQDELDLVVGPARLPSHDDRDFLPYINAIVKESLRWHTVLPLGIAHRCMEEDQYRGWRIPKGAVVLANVWSILHDPTAYPDPDIFRPERFLEDGDGAPAEVLDPGSIMFGFGRRVCPGRHFAEDTLFIYIASILHVYDILPARDAHGEPIFVEAQATPGFLSYIKPFRYLVRPRSKAAEALIRREGPDSQYFPTEPMPTGD